MKKIFFYFAVLLVTLFSCTEPIDVKLKDFEPKINVFGRIDDNPFTLDKVIVTRNVSYLRAVDSNYVADALVTISNSKGTIWNFEYKGKGLYLPPAEFTGTELNENYRLKVVHNGTEYTANSTVIPFNATNSNPIVGDSISSKADDNFFGNDTVGFRIWHKMIDDPSHNNYYYVDYSRNDTLLFYDKTTAMVNAFDDIIFNKDGLPATFPSPYTFKKLDKSRADLFAIDFETYKFYEGLSFQVNNSGSIFENPAANLKSNISNGAFGYFYAATSVSDTLTIK